MAELKHRFPARQVLEAMLAERLECCFRRQPVATQIVRDLGYERLPTVTGGEQTRHLVERRAEVVAVANFGGPSVKRHTGANRSVFRPTLRAERALRSQRGLDGARRGGEGGAEGVACGLEDVPAARLDALPQQSIVARQRFGHRLALRLPEPSAALDIREQKRHRAARERWRTGTMFDDHSIFYASGERETVANRSRPSERGRPPESGGRNASPRVPVSQAATALPCSTGSPAPIQSCLPSAYTRTSV